MIHLDLAGETGGALYLDVQQIEARGGEGECFALTGTLGDGLDEGQVLIEVGRGVEVLFIDEWLGGDGLCRLLRRTDRDALREALVAAAAGMRFCLQSFPAAAGESRPQVTGFHLEGRWIPLRPREYGEQLELPLNVAESAGVWQAA